MHVSYSLRYILVQISGKHSSPSAFFENLEAWSLVRLTKKEEKNRRKGPTQMYLESEVSSRQGGIVSPEWRDGKSPRENWERESDRGWQSAVWKGKGRNPIVLGKYTGNPAEMRGCWREASAVTSTLSVEIGQGSEAVMQGSSNLPAFLYSRNLPYVSCSVNTYASDVWLTRAAFIGLTYLSSILPRF